MSWFKRTPPETKTTEPTLGFLDHYEKLQREKAGIPEPRPLYEEVEKQLANLPKADTALGFLRNLRDRLDADSFIVEGLTKIIETYSESEAYGWLQERRGNFSPPIRKAINDALEYLPKTPMKVDYLAFMEETDPELFKEYRASNAHLTIEDGARWLVDNQTRFSPATKKIIKDRREAPAIEVPELGDLTKEEALATPFPGGITFSEYLTQENPLYAELALVMETYSDAEAKVWVKKNVERFPPDVRDDIIAAIAKHAHEIALAEKAVASRNSPK